MSDVIIGTSSKGEVIVLDTSPEDGVYQEGEKIGIRVRTEV